MLEPREMFWEADILRAAVSEIDPVALTPTWLVPRLIAPAANAVKLLSRPSDTSPANVRPSNGLPTVPIARPAVKSGIALIISVSAGLPQLIVSELVGLAKTVVSNDPLPLRSWSM